MQSDDLEQPLTRLPGIGPARASRLAAAFGIRTVGELLRCAPRRYESPARATLLAELQDGERARVRVRVTGVSAWRRGRRSTLRVRIEDDSAAGFALYFNQAYLKDAFPAGAELTLEGRASCKRGPTLIAPRIVRSEEHGPPSALQPVYPEVDGVSSGLLPRAIRAAFALEPDIHEPLPSAVLRAAGVPALPSAIHDLHRPPSRAAAERARRRLAWGEVLARELARRRAQPAVAVEPRGREARVWERILRRLPFEPTADQTDALEVLRTELAAGRRIARLLHGEVGSGKTAVAFALALAVAAGGGQTALLAPTEILARQHLATFRKWLHGSRIGVVGLLGDDPAAQRREALEALRHDTAAIAVGTHALYGPAVRFADLALVVLDEQHRFGVRQKAALIRKGRAPHVLTMTATPIPRTLAWAQYGALDPCVLRSRPGTGAEVRTHVQSTATWPQLARKLRPFLQDDGRLFLVAPRIDGAEGLRAHADRLAADAWSGIPMACVHGRMPGAEVARQVHAFREGSIRALLGTTVVEVGLDVPDVPAMVVLEAHRLGLASLHQLRGRLARGPAARSADCWFLGEPASLPRLRRLEICRDGFSVAEADLEERGPGALRGTRQHGRSDFKVFQPLRDGDLLEPLRAPAVAAFLEACLSDDPRAARNS